MTTEADLFPVSSAQARLLVAHGMDPDSPQYNVYSAFAVHGPLDVDLLEVCVNALVARHEVLRTGIRTAGREPVQAVLPHAEVRVTVAHGVPAAAARARLEADAGRPFDLSAAPLLRCSVLHVDDGSHLLVLASHHVVCDGWSMDLLLRELSADYRAGGPATTEPAGLQYADYAAWHSGRVAAGEFAAGAEFWRGHLAGAPALTPLPTDRPRTAVRTAAGGVERVRVPDDTAALLAGLARAQGTTVFTVLFAAFCAFLGRLTGEEDLVVGTPVAGRERADLQSLVGMLVNTVALRCDIGGDPAFEELVRRADRLVGACRPHFDVPFEEVVAALSPDRDPRHDPVFQVLFSLEDGYELALDLAGARVEPIRLFLDDARFDLMLHMRSDDSGLEASFSYRADLLTSVTVRRWADCFLTFLGDVVRRPRIPVGDAEVLPPPLRHTVLETWGRVPLEPAQNERDAPFVPVHERIARTAARQPDAPALVDPTGTVTYRELVERADALAARLRAHGAGPDDLVGVCRPRTADTLVALLGVHRAGAAYLPLDAEHPDARIASLIERSAPRVLLGDAESVPRLRALCGGLPVLDADADADADEQPCGAPRDATGGAPRAAGPHHLAYTLYTSGTTGRPKAVAVTQANLGHLVDAQPQSFGIGADDRVLQYASLTFDVSVWEIFAAWTAGAALCVVHDHERLGPDLLDALRRYRPTVAALPPTALGTLPPGAPALLPGPATLITTGEPCPQRLADTWAGDRVFVNAYGPTETTVWATLARLAPHEVPPIGRPCPGSPVRVLDARLRPVIPGATGEVYVGGGGPARGYTGDPGQTAVRFVADPYADEPGARMYRTGDLGHQGPDGRIYYHRRSDTQLKHHGVRIEAAEVETALTAHETVAQAVVTVRPDTLGTSRLVAHMVAAEGHTIDPERLRARLAERLPRGYLPDVYQQVAALPLNSSGKVDRAALPTPPAPGGTGTTARGPEPLTAAERAVTSVWAEVLGLPRVGTHDNFFDLGGNSLRLLAVHAGLVPAFPALRMVDLFRHPTVASLTEFLDGVQPSAGTAAGPQGRAPSGRAGAVEAGRRRAQGRRARIRPANLSGE
ncbi:non-ribosomal peptide synthetase [Streptomyces sulfonofaciens]|nr:non-ribosomal peptide synthetase [Streptomyces sulfonofaciens]